MKIDFKFSAEKVSSTADHGRKMEVEIEGAESGDVIECFIDSIGLDSIIDEIGIDNILDEIGISSINEYLSENGYVVKEISL